MTITPTDTASVLGHHLEAVGAGDLDALLSDYSPDVKLFTQSGVFNGIDGVKTFFEGLMPQLTPEFMEAFSLDVNEVDGDYAYIVWHSGTDAPLATDTFHVVDGKIVMQSVAIYMPS
jgi:ketosteroid isomerase-like protein